MEIVLLIAGCVVALMLWSFLKAYAATEVPSAAPDASVLPQATSELVASSPSRKVDPKKSSFLFWAISYAVAVWATGALATFITEDSDIGEVLLGLGVIIGMILMLQYFYKRDSRHFRIAVGVVVGYVLFAGFWLANNPTEFCDIFTDDNNYGYCIERRTR